MRLIWYVFRYVLYSIFYDIQAIDIELILQVKVPTVEIGLFCHHKHTVWRRKTFSFWCSKMVRTSFQRIQCTFQKSFKLTFIWKQEN